MLYLVGINVAAVIVLWIVNIVIGAFWYSPAGFQKRWSRLSGVDMMKTPKDETNRAIVYVAISGLLQVLILAVVLNSLRIESAVQGLITSVVIWFGFTALTTIGNTLYQRQSLKLWWLNASYFLVIMALDGIVLGAWR